MATPSTQQISIRISLILAVIFPLNCHSMAQPNKQGIIKGMFVFGSSLVDNGNNNFLQNSLAKANYFPYGIDFPSGPSGRFTNGKNVVDILGDHLRLPLIPPFNDPSTKGSKLIYGVNYASGASGILDNTGIIAGEVISFNKQMKNFEEVTLPALEAESGKKREELLPNYLFVVGTGGNDYSFNYFLNPSNMRVSLEQFTANLTFSLSTQLKKMYSLGGRKFVLMSVNPIGCYPMVKANSNRCIEALNAAAHLFNSHLRYLVDVLKPQMPASDIVLVNSYKILSDLITNPSSQGLKDASNPCCEVATITEGGSGSLCKRDGKVCEDRNSHVFFDGLHPTEAVNVIIASKAFYSTLQSEAYPINIKHLSMF